MRIALMMGVTMLLVGCGSSEPPQPKLSDDQVKEVMKQGKQQNSKESGGRGAGQGGPGK